MPLSWLALGLLTLVLFASAATLEVTPEGRWLSAATTIKFTSDLQNAQFRYYLTWKTLTPRPTNIQGTLWDGVPISISKNSIVTVLAYNASYYNQFAFQTHTYLFFSSTVDGSEFGYKMDLVDEWKAIPAASITYPEAVPVEATNSPTVAVSIEWIDPKDSEERFFYHGGIKYSGNSNVYLEKKSYRLYFSEKDYGGEGKVREDVFKGFDKWGILPAKKFDNLQFRSGSADSIVVYDWAGKGQITSFPFSNAQLIRNQFGDELQLQMGHRSAHSRHVHVFDNGLYMGIFQLRERIDSNYLADYVGLTKDDYEYINRCVLRDGNGTTWVKLYQASGRYEQFKQFVDVKQLSEYMALHFLTGNRDFNVCQNWQAHGPAAGSIDGGFQFYGTDIDQSLLLPGLFQNIDGPSSFWSDLWKESHPDFVQIWHDVLYDLFNDGGVLTPSNLEATYRYLMSQIEPAFDAEVARWRVFTVSQRYTKARWLEFAEAIIGYWMGYERQAAYFSEMETHQGWMYPGNPPIYSPLRGKLTGGATVSVTNRWSGTTVYYTLDGSDPRLPGGGLSPNALEAASTSQVITIFKSTTLSSRSRTAAGVWSPLQKKNFYVASQPLIDRKVILNEVVFSAFDGLHDVEFIEFKNTHNAPIDIMGCWIKSEYIRYHFNSTTIIPAGGYLVGTNQRAQFRVIYGKQADFFWSGNLKTKTEFKLVDAFDNTVLSAEWKNEDPWPGLSMRGYSLVPSPLYNPAVETKAKSGSDWRFSKSKKGSPWSDDLMPTTWTKFDQGNDYLIVNEALLTGKRWVEFKNIKTTPLDISNWFITDNLDKPTKYVVPNGTVVPAGGYWTRTQDELGFKLNDDVLWILNGVNDYEITFQKQLTGISRGRYQTSDGETYFSHLAAPTQGATNTVAYIPDVVISGFGFGTPENLYKDYKYIRLTNIGKKAVVLTDWKLEFGNEKYKFKQSGIHFFKLLPNQSIYLIQNTTSVSKFRKVMTKLEESAVVLNVIPLQGKDWYDKIKLQQPDKETKDEVTVDEIDVSRLSIPKKRSVEQANPGPNEVTRGLSPVLFSLEPKAWISTTLDAPLPVDCKWGEWAQWSTCMCDGTITRTREMTPEQFGGLPCVETTNLQSQVCTVGRVCDCVWLNWAEWTTCSATCGIGSQTRSRQSTPAQNGGALCAGNAAVSAPCKQADCLGLDCQWQEWGFWTDCDLEGKSCGWGLTTKSRGFIPAGLGGVPCEMNDQAEILDCEIPCLEVKEPSVQPPFNSSNNVDNKDAGLRFVFAIFLILVVLSLVVAIVLAFKARSNPQPNVEGYQAY